MKYTTNYDFKKPEPTDNINVEDFNDNTDIVDGKLKEHDDGFNSVNQHLTENADSIAKIESVKGQPNGTATLDEDGNVPPGQLGNIDTSNLASKEELKSHEESALPHQFSDETSTYNYGFKANTAKDGLIFVYEEVL